VVCVDSLFLVQGPKAKAQSFSREIEESLEMRNGFAFQIFSFISSLTISDGRIKTYGNVLFGFSWSGGTWDTKFPEKGLKTANFSGAKRSERSENKGVYANWLPKPATRWMPE